MRPADPPTPHLLLVGGGHAHVQVLRRHRERPFAARLSIALDHPESVYSGMVPGFVAGQYSAADLTIDVWALARTAAVRVIDAAALRVDVDASQVTFADRASVSFDLLSIDIGSTVAGLDLPGVRAHALSTRPIAGFVHAVDARLSATGPGPIAVVGAGAAGFELAHCLRARTKRDVVLVSLAPLAACRPGVAFIQGRVVEVTAEGPILDTGDHVAAALTVWATGAAALPLAEASGLPHEAGYLRVGPTLQVEGLGHIFAVGDCAHLLDRRGVPLPKAGVYAVREGPVLCTNLDAVLTSTQLSAYRPQKDFLALLNFGDGTARGHRFGLTFEGRWVWELKDHIDRRFMAMFQVLDKHDRPSGMAMPLDDDMACGGCAAKVGPRELHAAIAGLPPAPADPSVELGLAAADDAAVVRLPGGDRLGLTIDAFTAFCDDPYTVGRVAAVNAANDLFVKGITPRWALAVVGVPDEPGLLDEVMAGMRRGLDELGISLVGGHSLRSDQLSVGLSITGLAGRADLNGVPQPGDALVLTRGLGTGVLMRANAMGRTRGRWVRDAQRWMCRSHRDAATVLHDRGIFVATDVTGFGLYGHLATLLRRTEGVGAEIEVTALPLHRGVGPLFVQGVRSTFHAQNVRGTPVAGPGLAHPLAEIGFDPQTAGPLLIAVPAGRLQELLAALAEAGEPASRIGRFTEGPSRVYLV